MKTRIHTNRPDCCVTCELFHKNFVLTGLAKAPEPEEIAKDAEKLIEDSPE